MNKTLNRAFGRFFHRAPKPTAPSRDGGAVGPEAVLVSVIIPFHSGPELLRAAVHSVLAQSHRRIEILIVHDSPETDPSAHLPATDDSGPRIEVLCQHARGAGKARNFGLQRARGGYIAFLDADDIFLPSKIETQLALMQAQGGAISHTSYFVHGAQGRIFSGFQNSGLLSGRVFPDLIAHNPVAMPTVMIRRDIAAAFKFPDAPGCEDFLWLLEILRQEELLATAEPLSVVRISPDSTAYNPGIQARSLRAIVAALDSDPSYAPHAGKIAELRKLAADLEARIADRPAGHPERQ